MKSANFLRQEVTISSFTLKVFTMGLFTNAIIALILQNEKEIWMSISSINIQYGMKKNSRQFLHALTRSVNLKHSTEVHWKTTLNWSMRALSAINVISWIVITEQTKVRVWRNIHFCIVVLFHIDVIFAIKCLPDSDRWRSTRRNSILGLVKKSA